jgi:hypothetical protein
MYTEQYSITHVKNDKGKNVSCFSKNTLLMPTQNWLQNIDCNNHDVRYTFQH